MKTHLLKTGLKGALGAMLLLPAAASATLMNDDSFEQGAVGNSSYQTYNAVSTMAGWTVVAGSVDLISGYWQAASGSQSVNVAGNINGTIQQSINGLTIGQNYLLTFAMAGNPDNGGSVKTLVASLVVNSDKFTFDSTGHSENSMGWVNETATFTAYATTEFLTFQDLSTPLGTPYGSALDNVVLTAVPEPTTLAAGALLLLPFGASTLRILRRKQTL